MAKKSKVSINWKKVMWKETMWLNFLRALCVSPVMMIFFALNNSDSWMLGLIWPIYYFIAVPILLLLRPVIFWALGPFAPLLWIFLSLVFICGGDPIVFLISKIKPQLVPVQDFKFINFEIFIVVEKPENRRNGEGEMMDSDY